MILWGIPVFVVPSGTLVLDGHFRQFVRVDHLVVYGVGEVLWMTHDTAERIMSIGDRPPGSSAASVVHYLNNGESYG